MYCPPPVRRCSRLGSDSSNRVDNSNRSRRVAGRLPLLTASTNMIRFCGFSRKSPRPRASASWMKRQHRTRSYHGPPRRRAVQRRTNIDRPRSPRPARCSSSPSMNSTALAGRLGMLRKVRADNNLPPAARAVSRNRCVFPAPGSPKRTRFGRSAKIENGCGSCSSTAGLICRTLRSVIRRSPCQSSQLARNRDRWVNAVVNGRHRFMTDSCGFARAHGPGGSPGIRSKMSRSAMAATPRFVGSATTAMAGNRRLSRVTTKRLGPRFADKPPSRPQAGPGLPDHGHCLILHGCCQEGVAVTRDR